MMSHQLFQRSRAQPSEIPMDFFRSPRAPAHQKPTATATDTSRVCALAARLSARHFELAPAVLTARGRGTRRISRARHVAIYLAHVTLGAPLAAVASRFRRDRSTAAWACRLVEDLRERPAFDAAVAVLEAAAKALTQEARP
jgi:chromosomal replication initiation ATPase DnaA